MTSVPTPGNSVDYSDEFYRHHAHRYAEVSQQMLQSVYIKASHPKLKGDMDLLERMIELAPGRKGLDAGCGAGARDVHYLWTKGFDILGIDSVDANIQEAKILHPEIADRVSVADMKQSLDFPNGSFDFVLCNAVIQHIEPEILSATTLPELARVLKTGGVLQLMFKNGSGVISVYDKDYGADRSFQLYDEREVLTLLKASGCNLIAADDPEQLGGLMFFTDPKPVGHCVFYARKSID